MTLITKSSTLLVSESSNLATQVNTGGTGYLEIKSSGGATLASVSFDATTPFDTPNAVTGIMVALAVPLVGAAIATGVAATYKIFSGAAAELLSGTVGASYVFTANSTTEILTATGHPFIVGDAVVVSTDTTLPTPLSSATYFVISVSGADIQISTTLGGSTVNITDAGTGIHKIRLKSISLILDSGNPNPLQIYNGSTVFVNSFSYDPES